MAENISSILQLAAFVFIIVLIIRGFRDTHVAMRKCLKCKKKREFDELIIVSSELKWERKKQKGSETINGHDYDTLEIYKVYYRDITFFYKCSKCGEKHSIVKRYKLYDGRWNYSQSGREELKLLKRKIRKTLGKKFVGEKEIRIKNLDY